MAILFIIVLICGILMVNKRNEESGILKALKSLFMLIIMLTCMILVATGAGAVIGLPVLYAIGNSARKKM